jgi:ABC-type branched-subunit amino acid transport system ATPase component
MRLAMTLGQRVVALDRGRAGVAGTPDEGTRDPRAVDASLGAA